MERIIMDKLDTDLRCQPPVTPLTLLRVLYAAHNHLAAPLIHHPTLPPPLTTLIHKLEIVECDSAAATFRPSELALSLLALEFGQDTVNKHIHHACINHLQNICKVRMQLGKHGDMHIYYYILYTLFNWFQFDYNKIVSAGDI